MGYVTAKLDEEIYRLQCADGEEDRLRSLLKYVGDKLDIVRQADSEMDERQALILASVLITDELFTLFASQVDLEE